MKSVLIYFKEETELQALKEYVRQNIPHQSEAEGIRLLAEDGRTEGSGGAECRFLCVKIRGAYHLFAAAEIRYMEKKGRAIRIFSENGESRLFYGKFSDVLPALGNGFCHCHKSYVVNLEKVREIRRYSFCMESGETLPISQKKYQDVKECMGRYVAERERKQLSAE